VKRNLANECRMNCRQKLPVKCGLLFQLPKLASPCRWLIEFNTTQGNYPSQLLNPYQVLKHVDPKVIFIIITTMVVNNISHILIQLGLSDYEAKAYVALLSNQPATAYEISKHSGVPSSKIYEIVSRMAGKGLFLAVNEAQARGKQYFAISVEDFVARKKAETDDQTSLLLNAAQGLGNKGDANIIWPMNDESLVYSKARQLIKDAVGTCLISLWPEDLEHLDKELRQASIRGVKVALVHFGIPRESIGATYYHPEEKTLYAEKNGRGFTLVTDGKAVVMATFMLDGEVQGSWSQNQTFVTVAEDYIRHDVYITKVTAAMDKQVKAEFGDNYEKLRDVFTK